MVETYPILTLVPPILAILLVIVTKRVLISLFAGVVAGAILIADFSPLGSLGEVGKAALGLVWEDGGLNWYTILIIAFLLELGTITSLVLMAGGTSAFSDWVEKRVKTRRGAQILTGLLSLSFFIDDYFNALSVGQIARPISDRQRVSRAKLSYLIDSGAAPVVVLIPFSSWGASLIGIMSPILAASALQMSEVEAFVRAALMNFYAVAALVFLWLVIAWQLNFGPMRKEEERAFAGEGVHADEKDAPNQATDKLPRHEPGAKRALLVPFVLLILGVVGGMYVTGGLEAGAWDLFSTMANANVALSLNVGGVIGLIVAFYYLYRYTLSNPVFSSTVRFGGAFQGAKSMLPAISILLLAWMLGAVIGDLGTGSFLADVVANVNLPAHWLVPILFAMAGLMAFATGSSWGAFGILLPLAGQLMNASPGGNELLIAAFGAVIAGSVFGDHCSPISDTTILSSTGAGCKVSTHVNTQLPYALVAAGSSLVGYVVFAATGMAPAGFAVMLLVLVAAALVLRSRSRGERSVNSGVAAGAA